MCLQSLNARWLSPFHSNSDTSIFSPGTVPAASVASPATPTHPVVTKAARTLRPTGRVRPAASIPDHTEQASATSESNPEATELRTRCSHAVDDDEDKSESDVHDPAHTLLDLDEFDSDGFMDALRRVKLFAPTLSDDMNLLTTPTDSDIESDAEEEDVMGEKAEAAPIEEGVSDVEEVDTDDEENEGVMLGTSDEELRELTDSGWITYDAEHSGK
ncbi:hypothetical protein PHYPSEUDO_012689 [Phytophthora pseudosyringae]|uniref:Uncharacterized protein n=1 Tax=Phytophthora pseudosyringae TaxID=221518 RepID=A0A8T1V704_9STRA|nr:hypothetical protein PHYPSEUDO_012689 [Phytophthora pseudosyringae]